MSGAELASAPSRFFDEGELGREATTRKFRVVGTEVKRTVTREIEHYNLPAILTVGHRVRRRSAQRPREFWTRLVQRKRCAKPSTPCNVGRRRKQAGGRMRRA